MPVPVMSPVIQQASYVFAPSCTCIRAMVQRNLDCWGDKTSAVTSDTRPDADRHRQKHQKRSRRDEAETSSGSSSSSSTVRERRKRERKKERKQEKRKAKKEKKEKKEQKARKERKAGGHVDGRENDTHRQLPTVYAPPPPDVAAEAPPPTPEPCSLPGAKRPEQAEAERVAGQRVVKVWDPSLGVERSVRANGEVVEQCVRAACLMSRRPARARARTVIHTQALRRPSAPPADGPTAHSPRRPHGPSAALTHQVSRAASRTLQHDKARHVPTVAGPTRTLGPTAAGPERDTGPDAYTGRDKFPSQHPWFGYK